MHTEKDSFIWIYGVWANHGWGAMLVRQSDLKTVAFKPDGKKRIKVVDKVLYKKAK